MWEAAKRRAAKRIARFLQYHAAENHVDQARALGVDVGRQVAIWDTQFDAVYPWLVTIEDHCTLTGAQILCHDDSAVLFTGKRYVAPVRIRHHVFVGRGAIVMPGVVLGPNAVVGAGAVVTHDVPEGAVVAGIPARVVGTVEELCRRKAAAARFLEVEIGGNLPVGVDEERAQSEVRRAFPR